MLEEEEKRKCLYILLIITTVVVVGWMDGWMDETKKRGETAADVVTQYK
jgi:Tfp pilus assembly protein PilO